MRVLHLNTSDLNGGAAIAAYRLHKGLLNVGVDSRMIVQNKEGSDNEIDGPFYNYSKALSNIRPTIDHLPKLLYKKRSNSLFHLQWLPNRLFHKIKQFNPDVIHFHWVCRGFVNVSFISKLRQNLIWTLHDNWPFTGGCHYTDGCNRFVKCCGRCHLLNSNSEKDLSRWTWNRKKKAYQGAKFRLISPSLWMASQASNSSLFKETPCITIPNGIDTERFKPIKKSIARDLLRLPLDKTIILFTAMNALKDERKGLQLLFPAINLLVSEYLENNIELLVLGTDFSSTKKTLQGLKIHYISTLRDDVSIALVYSACDVFVAPSTEDNLPNTVLEALSCGIPCVAFNIGGMTDLIDHQKSGYLAKPYSIDDLANGIKWVISDQNRKTVLSSNARSSSVLKYDIKRIVERHLEIYNLQLNATV